MIQPGADVSSRLGQWDGNSWRTDAACFGMDPLTFIHVGDVGLAERQKTLAINQLITS
jgi:hypothetical protein